MTPSSTMTPDPPILEEGLYTLYQNISSTISFNFGYPFSEHQLRAATTNLLTYLTHYCTRNNKRRTKGPLEAKNLELNVLRTRNPAEESIDENGNRIKGEKKWYYLILSESSGGIGSGGSVKIIAEGGLREDKAELLDAFWEMVVAMNGKWEAQEEGMRKAAQKEERLERMEREAEVARREIAEMERRVRKKSGRRARRNVVDEEDEEDYGGVGLGE